jgi:molecular chaperone DnaK
MVKDAERHVEEDRKRKADIEARNRADNAHYQVQKLLQDNGDKLADADKRQLQDQMDTLKAALDRNAGSEELESATNSLMKAWEQVGAKMHQQTGGAPGGPGDGNAPGGQGPQGGAPGGEDVVDGEYRTM